MLAPASPAFLATLTARLPPGTLSDPEPRHLTEPRGRWTGQGALARPRTVGEVAQIVQACAAARVGIVPWGGGTGLVGGQLMSDGPLPVILSLERMAAVRAVHPKENVLIAEAGVTLAAAQAAAGAAGRLFPLSLASEGSATIGGNLATNAGGVNVVRWGNARDLCLGLEVVLADGTVWHGLRRLRKDNTGYDLRHLMIGSEGTLGIITAASLRLVAPPASRAVALLVVDSPAAALDLFHRAEARLPGLVSAFELMSGMGFRFLSETLPDIRQPFAAPPGWTVLLDLGLPGGLDPSDTMEALVTEAADLVRDGLIAQSAAQAAAFWHLREAIPEANRKIGAVSSHDISLPLSVLPAFIARADRAVAALGPFRINCFGHLGDGNLHYNVFPPQGARRSDFEGLRETVKGCVHDLVHAMDGSVSAEHGIGRLKTGDLERYGDPVKLAAMRAIKAALDPLGILNPGAVLPR